MDALSSSGVVARGSRAAPPGPVQSGVPSSPPRYPSARADSLGRWPWRRVRPHARRATAQAGGCAGRAQSTESLHRRCRDI
eukprot:scaffold103603_cov23-Tisochrysis_lutea.AAC.3